jgi:uncharacterized protein (TIGR02246 family)
MSAKSAGILGGCMVLAALLVVFVPRLLPASGPGQPITQGQGGVAPTRQELLAKQLDASYQTFVANDAKAHAAVYAPDADFTETTGEVFRGREAVEKFFADTFSRNKITPVKMQLDSQRYVTPEVLVMDGSFAFAPRQDGGPTQGRYTSVWAFRDGQWLIVCHRSYAPTKQAGP